MTRLAIVSTAVGALTVAVRVPGILAPAKFREHAIQFPRSELWGKILMGIAAAIAWWSWRNDRDSAPRTVALATYLSAKL